MFEECMRDVYYNFAVSQWWANLTLRRRIENRCILQLTFTLYMLKYALFKNKFNFKQNGLQKTSEKQFEGRKIMHYQQFEKNLPVYYNIVKGN